jgi:hypothetical protein
MLATLLTILAQRGTQEPPDEGIGIGLILGAVVLIALIAFGVFMLLRTISKRERGGPPNKPHEPGHVGSRDTV